MISLTVFPDCMSERGSVRYGSGPDNSWERAESALVKHLILQCFVSLGFWNPPPEFFC